MGRQAGPRRPVRGRGHALRMPLPVWGVVGGRAVRDTRVWRGASESARPLKGKAWILGHHRRVTSQPSTGPNEGPARQSGRPRGASYPAGGGYHRSRERASIGAPGLSAASPRRYGACAAAAAAASADRFRRSSSILRRRMAVTLSSSRRISSACAASCSAASRTSSAESTSSRRISLPSHTPK